MDHLRDQFSLFHWFREANKCIKLTIFKSFCRALSSLISAIWLRTAAARAICYYSSCTSQQQTSSKSQEILWRWPAQVDHIYCPPFEQWDQQLSGDLKAEKIIAVCISVELRQLKCQSIALEVLWMCCLERNCVIVLFFCKPFAVDTGQSLCLAELFGKNHWIDLNHIWRDGTPGLCTLNLKTKYCLPTWSQVPMVLWLQVHEFDPRPRLLIFCSPTSYSWKCYAHSLKVTISQKPFLHATFYLITWPVRTHAAYQLSPAHCYFYNTFWHFSSSDLAPAQPPCLSLYPTSGLIWHLRMVV